MLNDIVINILSGVAATIILEFLRSRFANAAAPAGAEPGGAPAAPPTQIVMEPAASGGLGERLAGMIGRMGGALIFGFLFSAVSAGVMESASGHRYTIEFGTPAMIVLFTACTFLGWAGLAAASSVLAGIGKAFVGFLAAIIAWAVLVNVEATASIAAGDAVHESVVFAALAILAVLLLRVAWPPKRA